MNSRFVFVREDASKPSLAPLYRGPYRVVERRSKFFRLQIETKIDSVFIDHLKPVFSDSPVIPATPPLRGRPPLRPNRKPPEPTSAVESFFSMKKKSVKFLIQPEEILTDRLEKEGPAPPYLLGEVLWRKTILSQTEI